MALGKSSLMLCSGETREGTLVFIWKNYALWRLVELGVGGKV